MLYERFALQSAMWKQTRGDFQLSADAPTATLLALGDIALTRRTNFDFRTTFGPIADRLESCDLATGNLEAALTGRTAPAGSIGSFIRADPDAVRALVDGHLDVVNLANNHALDFGTGALADTAELLRDSGIGACGVRRDGASAPLVIRETKGLRVGFLGACDDHFVPLPSGDEPDCQVESDLDLLALIAAARPQVDFLVLQLHWGYEFSLHPLLEHRDRARKLAEMGVDLIVCHHAHVPQGIEVWQGAIIAYGLGNAIMPLSPYMRAGHWWSDRSFALEVDFGRSGISAARLVPYGLAQDGSIISLSARDSHNLLAGIGTTSRRIADQGYLARLSRARTAYEFVGLVGAFRAAAQVSDSSLAERARSLTLARQSRLLASARDFEEFARAVDGLLRVAAVSDDAGAVRAEHEAIGASLETILARPPREYRWRDAVRSRVP